MLDKIGMNKVLTALLKEKRLSDKVCIRWKEKEIGFKIGPLDRFTHNIRMARINPFSYAYSIDLVSMLYIQEEIYFI